VAVARWEHYDHGQALGVRGFGRDRSEAFEQAALALAALVTDPALVFATDEIELACEADDDDLLLARWLDAVILEMATRRMVFGRFDVRIDGTRLRARAWGEGIDAERHRPAVEIKGARPTTPRVARHDDGWLAQAVLALRPAPLLGAFLHGV
jgi:SHS2 domain-containing protein